MECSASVRLEPGSKAPPWTDRRSHCPAANQGYVRSRNLNGEFFHWLQFFCLALCFLALVVAAAPKASVCFMGGTCAFSFRRNRASRSFATQFATQFATSFWLRCCVLLQHSRTQEKANLEPPIKVRVLYLQRHLPLSIVHPDVLPSSG